MSRLNALLRRLAAWLTEPVPSATAPYQAVTDWADLPAHHPRCDKAPC